MSARSKSGTGVAEALEAVERRVVECRLCPRLVEWRERVAREKVRRHRDETYWGRPVPAFGDPAARLLIVGLAPGAHGANRTGRMFTGDDSGKWLYRALHRAGFASQAESVHAGDGLRLIDCWITASGRCAPPDNKPLPQELANCAPFLDDEVRILWPGLRVVVPLGQIAFAAWLQVLKRRGVTIPPPVPKFQHLAEIQIPGSPLILCSYHPSRQNTQTGRLTEDMFDAVWSRARQIMDKMIPEGDQCG